MKKIIKIMLIVFVFIIFLTGCNKDSKYIKEISFDKFKSKMANKESFVLYVGNENCPHCVSYKPTLEKVLKENNITIYNLDNSKLSEKKYNEFKTYININGTPTVAFIINGTEESTLNRIVGETSEEDTIEMFKVNGYIK